MTMKLTKQKRSFLLWMLVWYTQAIAAVTSDDVNIAKEDDTKNITEEVENCWLQIGTDLDGERLSNSFGASVDLSSIIVHDNVDDSDNNTNFTTSSSSHISIAVGGYGYARIFDYTLFDSNIGNGNNTIFDGEWMPLGDRIEGDQLYDEFGFATSLSANGRVVALGAPSHKYDNGDAEEDGSEDTHGLVKVYTYSTASKSWHQLGQVIGGYEQRFGHSVSLSDDGHTIIVGTVFLGFTIPNTRVFRYDKTAKTWNILGEPIPNWSGSSTSISSDGSIVAIGAVSKSITRVYTFTPSPNSFNNTSTTSGTWTQMGMDIVGERSNDKSGTSVSLTPDGLALAIGAKGNDGDGLNATNAGHVRIYHFNNTTKDWEQRGQDIDGEAKSDHSGAWVSLSEDARTVAIGAWANDGNGPTAGHARVYRYDEDTNDWTQYGQDIDGANGNDAAGARLSLSPDGSILAIGSKFHDSQVGHVRVFANTKKPCKITQSPSFAPTVSTPIIAAFPSDKSEYFRSGCKLCSHPNSSLRNGIIALASEEPGSPPENSSCEYWDKYLEFEENLRHDSYDCLRFQDQLTRQCCDGLPPLYELETILEEQLLGSDSTYKSHRSPIVDGDSVNVNIFAELFRVAINDYGVDGGKIEATTSFTIWWFDKRLQWNSTLLPSITLDWENVWVPPLNLESAAEVSRGKVKVFANGVASWKMSAQLLLQCEEKQTFSKNCTTILSEIRSDSRVNFIVSREMEIADEILETSPVKILASSVNMTNGIVKSPNLEVFEEYEINDSSRLTDKTDEYDAAMHRFLLTIDLAPLGSDCNICGDGTSNNLINDGKIYEYPEEWLKLHPNTNLFSCRDLDSYLINFSVANQSCYVGRAAFEEPCCDDYTSEHDCEQQMHDVLIERINTVTLPDPSNQESDFGTRFNGTDDKVDVKVNLDVSHLLAVDVKINSMTLSVSLELIWYDIGLAFEPFIGGCHHISFRASLDAELTEIWVPQIELLNLIDGVNTLPDAFASVRYDGRVTWRRSGILQSTCELTGIRDFPYDKTSCYLEFGETKDPILNRVNYFFDEDDSIGYSESVADNKFDFQEYRLKTNLTNVFYGNNSMSGYTRKVIIYKFFFDRAKNHYIILFIIPYIFFGYLAIGVYFVDYSLGERLGYGSSILFVIVAQDITLLDSTPVTNSILWINKISLASKGVAIATIFQSIVVLYIYTHHEFEEDATEDNDMDGCSFDEPEFFDALIINDKLLEENQPEENQTEEIQSEKDTKDNQNNKRCCFLVDWTAKKILRKRITEKDKKKTRKIKILRSIDFISAFICFTSYTLFLIIVVVRVLSPVSSHMRQEI